jgi:Rhodopirellula transposase DDE domain
MKAPADTRSSERPNTAPSRAFSADSSPSHANSEPDHAATDIADLPAPCRKGAEEHISRPNATVVLGAARYPTATRLLITADCGGSNGARVRLWKRELQVLADELGIAITVCHLPPGTSKWNRIEHRLFAFITQNWRGKPLVSHQVIVQLIANTRTKTGLTVACRIDASAYEKSIKVSDAEMAALNIQPANFHGEWNYTFTPRPSDT